MNKEITEILFIQQTLGKTIWNTLKKMSEWILDKDLNMMVGKQDNFMVKMRGLYMLKKEFFTVVEKFQIVEMNIH